MIIFGDSFCSNYDTALRVGTSTDETKSVRIQNMIIRELYMTRATDFSIDSIIPEWDYYTLLHAIYDGNIEAGNTNFGIDNTTDILIKRRKKGTFKWLTIYHKVVTSVSDFYIITYDKYCQSGVEYEYALVPVNVAIEGTYNIASAISSFDGSYLFETDDFYEISLNLELNRQRNRPSAIISPLNSKKAIVVQNGEINYESGTFSSIPIRRILSSGEYDLINAWDYREKYLDFLTDGNTKVLKTFDGKIKIIRVVETPQEAQGQHWNAPTTSVSYVEVGDFTNEELNNLGLLDIDRQWWVI